MTLEQTVMASEIVRRLEELIATKGDAPIWLMEPMNGVALPMAAQAIEFKNDRFELWPQS